MGRNSRAVAAAAPVAGVPSRASTGAGTGVWSVSRSPPVAETPPRRQHNPHKSRAPPPPPPTAQPQAASGNAQQTTPSPQQHTWQIGKRRAPQPPSTYCLDKASLHLASAGPPSLRQLRDTPRTVLATARAPQLQIVAENLTWVEAVNRVLTGELSDPKMPAVLTQKPSGTMQKVSPVRARNSYFFGEFDHHVTASLTTNLSEASEGSSTDVGVCLSDSASDISQDSLVETSDSAVSSPTVRRVSFESSEPAGTPTQHADLRLTPSSRCSSRPAAAELPQARTSASSSVVSKVQLPVHQSQSTTRQSQSPIRQSSELLRQKPKKPIPVPQVFESHYEATIAVPQKQNSLYVSSLRLTQSRSNDDGTIGGGIKDNDSVSHDAKTHRRRGAAESSLQDSPLKIHQTATPKPAAELPCSPPARPPKPSAMAQTCSPHRKTSQNKAKPRPSSSMAAHSKTGPASLRPRPVSCVSPSASAVMRASLSVLDDFPSRPHSIHLASSPSEVGFHFHLNEMEAGETAPEPEEEDDGFAGVKDFLVPTDSTIRSGRGTVRGVKNRVRAGIATFLHGNTITKGFKERERGRLVVYITTMGIVRSTYAKCMRMRHILRTQMVVFEERDLFLSVANQHELRERLGGDSLQLPQLFMEGQLLGGSETVERLNETGELRRMLKPYKSTRVASACEKCGGFRMLPCTSCNGSKKSCHRNYFTCEWVVLRCCACDDSGLIVCDLCKS